MEQLAHFTSGRNAHGHSLRMYVYASEAHRGPAALAVRADLLQELPCRSEPALVIARVTRALQHPGVKSYIARHPCENERLPAPAKYVARAARWIIARGYGLATSASHGIISLTTTPTSGDAQNTSVPHDSTANAVSGATVVAVRTLESELRHAALCSETNLPAELIPQFTTIEYALPRQVAGVQQGAHCNSMPAHTA
jgi:hypothetical protein